MAKFSTEEKAVQPSAGAMRAAIRWVGNFRKSPKLELELAAIIDSETGAPTLEAVNKELLQALEQWKCPSCGGTRKYTGFSKDAPEGQDCRKCKDTDGLHPIAWAAIAKARGIR